ncbi:MAG: hypothetical protein UW68_C0050G0002 [Candidatus Collierbacteria bacterium GW2011_GWB1_44_6]|uniref:Uncharacterized protein n=1 Tax=Candidatus Collierbacteria bacterium GW2011_GWB1_44_6 TaxID=1618384 RepID=A0A0G1MJ52_9BACT|nr:MAG: hypothetical protein UW68_C0050G0002 [Candidatus Collierbacteria bacterium GW2011_GWB1_44_6]KKT81146.1 MAG: hypothetical protein UW80_C0057G0002 [Microgenomates group bacterium GW2011_GWC1_44_9]
MNILDLRATLAATISVLGGNYFPKGRYTPYVKITRVKVTDQVCVTEGFSLFYKSLRTPAIVESNIYDLVSQACRLTAMSLENFESGEPVRQRVGFASILKISKTEFVIVAVVGDLGDSPFVCNSILKIVKQLK